VYWNHIFHESSKEISPINFNQQFCCFCSGRRTSKRIYTNSALASGTATGVRLIPDTNAGWIVRKEHPEIYVDIPWFITTYNYIDISWYIHHKSFLAIAWLHTNLPITQRGPFKKRHAYVDGQLHRESYEFLVHVISGPFMILKKTDFLVSQCIILVSQWIYDFSERFRVKSFSKLSRPSTWKNSSPAGSWKFVCQHGLLMPKSKTHRYVDV
jgi:hypothetical protein